MAGEIYKEVELSMKENLIPVVIHVKQYDNGGKKIRCVLYDGALEYRLPENCIVSLTGTRPDGKEFQYSSEANPALISASGCEVVFTVTDFMTEKHGRYLLDLSVVGEDGRLASSFGPVLRVERAAVPNAKLILATFAGTADTVGSGIYDCYITPEGYFAISSEDGLALGEGSYSGTLEMVKDALNVTTITDSVYLSIVSEERLGLSFFMDSDGKLFVTHG